MTDGLDISGGEFVVTKDGRRAIDTAAHYVMGLPSSAQSLTKTITYPDPPKSYGYNWKWSLFDAGNGGRDWQWWETGSLWIALLGQEWVQDTVVCAAPTVVDGTPLGFLGKVRLNRTKAPSHNVYTATLSTRVPANKWIPNSGSMLLEYVEFGVARTLTLTISGGNLILRQRQSITSAYPGGYNANYGDSGTGTIPSGSRQQGGNWLSCKYTLESGGGRMYGSAYSGMLAFNDPTQDNSFFQSTTLPVPSNNPGISQNCNPAATAEGSTYLKAFTDPTDYSSVYTVDIEGEFVRLT